MPATGRGTVVSLKSEGFTELVADVARVARSSRDVAVVTKIALTLDGRLGEDIGSAALTAADQVLVELLRCPGIHLNTAAPDTDDRLFLTRTGRLAVRLDGAEGPDDAFPLGGVRWGDVDPAHVKARARAEHDRTARAVLALHAELVAEPEADVHARLARIEHAVVHMAPVLIYVDEHVYTNLTKAGTLPGKSLSASHPRSLLNRLRATPVADWNPVDACFVACADVLLMSGPPVRLEEFNGTQLDPDTLRNFLVERIGTYGGGALPGGTSLRQLEELAARCAELRKQTVGGGESTPYRVINGLNLHKSEHLLPTPAVLGDAPEAVMGRLAELLGVDSPVDTRIADLAPLFADLAGRLVDAAAPDGFTTAFEAVLHAFVTTAAEAFDADVAMSRGPETFDPLRVEHEVDPLGLGTGDFYCCVAPRQAFVERFREFTPGLTRALSAYSARMRFNTWHYLPSTLGIVEREPGRDDWFFAPTMPDVASWSDQHHTGHVAFGVRYAIRVPFGIEYDGRAMPGLYDLRLMRTSLPAFTVAELRGAIATALLLKQLYQAMSVHDPKVVDFGKSWYERFHG
ncbi:hypothetical protein [Umezawaea sp.]|uniref:hypothetical protein n=1 Tax=Umezawaea sp. TaxID=1955258 RepID=UPI002ED2D174